LRVVIVDADDDQHPDHKYTLVDAAVATPDPPATPGAEPVPTADKGPHADSF
jgi:hypothetical protein